MGGSKGVWEGVITFRRCENHHAGVCERCKGMWRSVTPVSMLRVHLTVTGEV